MQALGLWILFGIIALLTLLFLKLTLNYLFACYAMWRTPRTTISNAKGYAEISGKTRPSSQMIKAPLSGQDCVYYAFKIYKRVRNNQGKKQWRVIRKAISRNYFILRDESGDCLVDLDGVDEAQILTIRWRDSIQTNRNAPAYPGLARSNQVLNFDKESKPGLYRFEEKIIPVGQSLYLQGMVEEVIDKPANLKAVCEQKEKTLEMIDDKLGMSVKVVDRYEKEFDNKLAEKTRSWESCSQELSFSPSNMVKVVSMFGGKSRQPLLVSIHSETSLLVRCLIKALASIAVLVFGVVISLLLLRSLLM